MIDNDRPYLTLAAVLICIALLILAGLLILSSCCVHVHLSETADIELINPIIQDTVCR